MEKQHITLLHSNLLFHLPADAHLCCFQLDIRVKAFGAWMFLLHGYHGTEWLSRVACFLLFDR